MSGPARSAEAEHTRELEPFPQEKAPGCPFDLPPRYRTLQADEPAFRAELPSGQQVWVLTRHHDICAVLDDPRFSADSARPNFPSVFRQAAPQVLRGTFVRMDGAEHLRYRRMLGVEFTPRKAEQMRPRITEVVDARIDAMLAAGPPVDLMSMLAYPVPSTVVSELLGVPHSDHERFEASTQVLVNGRSSVEEMMRAKDDILAHLNDLVAAKERDPGADLISRMLVRHVATGELDRSEVAVVAWLLLAAGHHTTATMIGTGTALLLRHPDQLAVLRTDPPAIPNAVEELLRHQTAMQIGMNRVALEDVRVGDVLIRAGEGVICQLASANRDPDVYPDPDAFDVRRSARRHVAFGFGPHQCLGQTLARVELQVVLGRLFDRLPGLRLAVAEDELPFWHHLFGIHGVRELPVAW